MVVTNTERVWETAGGCVRGIVGNAENLVDVWVLVETAQSDQELAIVRIDP